MESQKSTLRNKFQVEIPSSLHDNWHDMTAMALTTMTTMTMMTRMMTQNLWH